MKFVPKNYTALTIVLVTLLLCSCVEKKQNQGSSTEKAYQIAQKAQDYQNASTLLIQLAAEDSAGKPWVYDSLAYYHYFYLITPGVVRNTHTARYYCDLGLGLNPENYFLSEIKAKMDLEDQKVEEAQAAFSKLFSKTKDYTYLWILTYIKATEPKGLEPADSTITAVLADPEAEKKMVRLEFPQERITEKIPVKTAFTYLRASFLLEQNKLMEGAKLLEECLKMTPEFYGAKRLIYMMQQGGGRQ